MIVEPRSCVAILVALSVLPLGCGSTKKVTRNDVATVRALLNATAAVQKAVEPLYACRPQKPDCYRRSGPALSVVAERQKARLTAALRETDNSCLKKTSGVVVQDLDAYLGAGRAATAGDPIRVEKELTRSTDLEVAYYHRIGTCGFTQGRIHEIGSRVRLANAAILRLGDEMRACRTVSCVHRVARRLGQEARKGISNLDEFSLSAGSDMPQCVWTPIQELKKVYVALRTAAAALQRNDVDTAESESNKADRLQLQAGRDMTVCLESVT